MLSDKFVAGFTDADGSINLNMRFLERSPGAKPSLTIVWSQKKDHNHVIHEIKSVFGGSVKDRKIGNGVYTDLVICGSKALSVLYRLLPYLVVKKSFAAFCIDRIKEPVGTDGRTLYLKARKTLGNIPNFPSRKWLAGYFDGDGCLSINRLNKNGSANIVAHIACSDYDSEGIRTIQKNFGGHIYPMSKKLPNVLQWKMHLSPSKAVEFLSYFNSNSVVKRDQIDYVLSCARMGHFRDGERIQKELKRLKAMPTSRD